MQADLIMLDENLPARLSDVQKGIKELQAQRLKCEEDGHMDFYHFFMQQMQAVEKSLLGQIDSATPHISEIMAQMNQ